MHVGKSCCSCLMFVQTVVPVVCTGKASPMTNCIDTGCMFYSSDAQDQDCTPVCKCSLKCYKCHNMMQFPSKVINLSRLSAVTKAHTETIKLNWWELLAGQISKAPLVRKISHWTESPFLWQTIIQKEMLTGPRSHYSKNTQSLQLAYPIARTVCWLCLFRKPRGLCYIWTYFETL